VPCVHRFQISLGVFSPGLPGGMFSNLNLNLGKLRRALEWKMLICFMAIWNILQPFGIFYDHLLMVIWYIFPRFWYMLCLEKSGNPGI
jgi:hypothetical protein